MCKEQIVTRPETITYFKLSCASGQQTAPSEAAAYAPHRGPRSREACPQPSRCATTRTPSRQRGRRASGAARTRTLRAAAPARRRAMAPQAKARTYHAPRAGAKRAYGSPRCGPHRLWRSETLLKAAACCAFRSCVHLVAFGLGLPAPWQPGAQIVFFFWMLCIEWGPSLNQISQP